MLATSRTQKEDQDAALDGSQGRDIIATADDAGSMLSKAGDILVFNTDSSSTPSYSPPSAGPAKDAAETEEPPPYSYEPSAASESSATPGSSAAGPSIASTTSAQGGGWGVYVKHTFKALTAGLRAKPDPLVTALCEASRRGEVTQVAALLSQGANTDGKNEDGETPLQCAILANQEGSARLLLSSGAGEEKQWSKMPPMFLAASVGNVAIARLIYERGGPGANTRKDSMSGQPYFVDVVSSGNLDGVRFLLERGARAGAQSIAGRPVVVQAARKGNIEMVRLLLDFGAEVNANDITGNSMLAIALDKSNLELTDLLLARGAKPNSKTTSGERVLATALSRRNLPFAQRLLEAGADGNVDDIYGQKVIVSVVKDTKISDDDKVWLVRMLLDRGAKTTSKDIMWPSMHLIPLAVDKDVGGSVIALLCQRGADSGKMLQNGETPLTHAINNGRIGQIKALLENGADLNLSNKSGKTPLMQAVVKQDLNLIKLLVERGADVDAQGHSAREFALTLGRADILEALGFVSTPNAASGASDARPGYDAAVPGRS